MALADPQVLPGSPTINLDRVSSALGDFAESTGERELTVQHNKGNRIRHVVKLTLRKIAADPLLPAQNREFQQSVHVVIDQPLSGFTNDEVLANVTRFVNYLGTSGLLLKIIQGQS